MTDLQAVFHRPFKEQVAAWRLRMGNQIPTARWDDIQKAQHDRSFMVAGAMKADLLADLAAAVDKAITEGRTLEEFRRDFRRIVKERGWHGWTGEGTQAGENWRTRIIYRTNMRTSYMAGRYAQLMSGPFPLWVYKHGGSADPRPHHLALDGLVLPREHPFWQTHFPPNDWNCSCSVTGARNERHARRKGGDPAKALPDNWNLINERTGEPGDLGKGWGYAPGTSVAGDVQALAPKLEKLPAQPSQDLIRSWLTETLFGKWLEAPDGDWPLVRLSEAMADRIGASSRVAFLSAQTARKQLAHHPELTIFDYGEAQRVVSEATEVLSAREKELVFVFSPPDAGGHILVVKATAQAGRLFVTSFRRISGSPDERRRELERLRRRNR
jgi:hypothetical protein